VIALGPFVVGLVFLLLTFGAVVATAVLALRRRLPELSGLTWLLAFSILATVDLIGVHLLPGALGVLNRETVLLTAMLTLGVVALARRASSARDIVSDASNIRRPDASNVSLAAQRAVAGWLSRNATTALAIAATALFCAYALAYLKINGSLAPFDTDSLSFHLPDVGRWIQTGTFWQNIELVPLQSWGAYPNNGDVVLLAWVLPFRSDVLVRVAMLPYLGLAAIAIVGIARELRASTATGTLVAVALVAMPAVVTPSLVNVQTDAVMLATFASGLYFLLRHRRTRRRADLVLAGLALGVAFGTKWYGVTSVTAVIVVWAVAWLLADRRLGRVLSETLTLSAAVIATGGFWLVRNLVETGDPFFPVKVAPFGVTIFNAPPDVLRQLGGFTIGHYLGSPAILRHYVAPALWHTLGLSAALLGATTVVTGGIAILRARRRPAPDSGTVIALVAGAVVLTAVYVITPYTAFGPRDRPLFVVSNTRYLMPALVPAAAVTCYAMQRLARGGLLLAVALLAGVVISVRHDFGLHVSGTVALVGVLVVLAGSASRALSRLRPRPIVLACAIAVFVAGSIVQRGRFSDQPYRTDAVLAWLSDHASSGHRVGLAGQWSDVLPPVLSAFGPRFGNYVAYVGPMKRHVVQLVGYAGPFEAALKRGRFDMLIVGRGRTPPEPVREDAWARKAGYRQIVQSPQLTLFASGGANTAPI
jgi:hypothetical protein